MDRFTQEKISLWLCPDQEDVANNLRKRGWRPGLPVAHVAIASDVIHSTSGREEMVFFVDLAHVALTEMIVALTRHMEAVVHSNPRFKVTPDDLLHFEWVA